jgi:hypothetical protein
MVEPRMPGDVVAWMDVSNWGSHHLEWHTVRQWDLLDASEQAWATSQGWARFARQEGTVGNGFDFLLMHRAMIQLLRETFPAYTALFAGWSSPPTDPSSVRDPMPFNSRPRTFSSDMRTAVSKLHSPTDLAAFPNDDALGLFIETTLRPTSGDPGARSPDPIVGIHNYLHGRFSDSTSDINMGSPEVNLANERFWRLHGWIDARWSAFRSAKGLSDTDPGFVAALNAEKTHLQGMGGHVHPMGIALRAVPAGRRAALARAAIPRVVPASIAQPFRDHISRRFAAAMSAGDPTNLDELKERIQLAIELELFTIPPYLTAAWSLKSNSTQTTMNIRSLIIEVAIQEMLHMGLMCNLLVAVGGKPVLNHPDHLPSYPNFPPGIDLPNPVSLEPFSQSVLDQFLKIEHPQHDPVPIPVLHALAAGVAPKFPTIGDFYDSLKAGLVHATSFNPAGQLTIGFGTTGDNLTQITTLAEAEAAIDLIKEQGEGNSTSPAAGPSSDNLAHYYRFLQIKDGRKYVKQADGTFKQDPGQPLPFPAPAEIYSMAPVPAAGYPGLPEAVAFDTAYSKVVQLLHDAWDQGSQGLLVQAWNSMYSLESPATALMDKPREQSQGGNYGPAFLWRTATTPPPEPPAGPPPVASGYARIQQILDGAVQGQTFGAHGPFWRTITRDQFVVKSIFGQKLLAKKPDGSFDPVESNLMKALEGRAPFDGTVFKRMPDGFPPLTDPLLAEIKNWIASGCPDTIAVANWFDNGAGGPVNGQQHIDYWRDFDDWAMFNVTDPVSADIGTFFGAVNKWMEFAKDATQEPAWAAAIAAADLRDAVSRLEARQRDTVVKHYGKPVPLLTLLDGYERFGDNSLPDDPLRPADVRHTMNGDTMWFIWSAFTDACLRIGGTIPTEFWQGMGRAQLTGLLNDGLFRGRFRVTGFAPDASGKVAVRDHARTLPVANLQAELRSRYRDFLT